MSKDKCTPSWLCEGSNEYEMNRLFDEYELYPHGYLRASYRDRVWGLNKPLGSVELLSQSRAEDNAAMYILGFPRQRIPGREPWRKPASPRNIGKLWAARPHGRMLSKPLLECRSRISTTSSRIIGARTFLLCVLGLRDTPAITLRFDRQLAPGSFYAFPKTYIPYVFCVNAPVGAWSPKQREDGFKLPPGVSDTRIGFCGGGCIVLGIPPDTAIGKYVFAMQAPDGKKAEVPFQHGAVAATIRLAPSRIT